MALFSQSKLFLMLNHPKITKIQQSCIRNYYFKRIKSLHHGDQYVPFINYLFTIKFITQMKNSLMRPPAITEIYSQKLTYQNHLKKLSQIREDRKHQLQFDHSRQSQLQHIKQAKSKSFAHKFNEQSLQINQSNVKLLVKLEKVQPFARYTSYISSDRITKEPAFLKPITKRKIVETQKENSRLFYKMKSVSSTLSKDRMMNDYAKAQRIKERITKYANDNNKVALKSQKYFSQNKSFVSSKSSDRGSTDRLKNNLVSHYKKEEILKNRISSTEHKLFKQKRQNRPLPSLGSKEYQIEEDPTNYIEEKNVFFTTEPEKNKKRSMSTNRKKV